MALRNDIYVKKLIKYPSKPCVEVGIEPLVVKKTVMDGVVDDFISSVHNSLSSIMFSLKKK